MWKRAWQDTRQFLGWNKKTLTVPISYVISLVIIWQWQGTEAVKKELGAFIALGFAGIAILAVWIYLFNLIRAPVYIAREREKKPKIKVMPKTGRRQYEYENPHLMWAELCITNTSPIASL
ncbi:hypothetical protein ACFLVI_00925, partial [Chloroflexota bacterium]